MSATDTVDPRLLFARLRLASIRRFNAAHTCSHTVRGETHRLGPLYRSLEGAGGEEGALTQRDSHS